MAGEPLVDVDENAPLRPDSRRSTRARRRSAEQAVLAANGDGFETVVSGRASSGAAATRRCCRTSSRWSRAGRFAWIGGGRHRPPRPTWTTSSRDCGSPPTRGRPGGVYFVTDGEPVVFRDFLTRLLATQGVDRRPNSVPAGPRRRGRGASRAVWRPAAAGGRPLTRFAVWLSSQECTIDISRARRELGYAPVISREQGLASSPTVPASSPAAWRVGAASKQRQGRQR